MRENSWLTYTSGHPASRMSTTLTLTGSASTTPTTEYSQPAASAGTR